MNYRIVVITLEPTVLATLLDKKKNFRKDFFFFNYNQTYCLFRSDIRHNMEMFHTILISHIVYILYLYICRAAILKIFFVLSILTNSLENT